MQPLFCPTEIISQYLFVRFDSDLVQMISTMNSRCPISFAKINPLTLDFYPCKGNYNAKPISIFVIFFTFNQSYYI